MTFPIPAQPGDGVPFEKLLALLRVSDEMGQSVFRRDRQATLDTVAGHVHDLLNAEACAVFLVPEDAPRELVLAARRLDKEPPDQGGVRLRIESAPGSGLTGHIADEGRIVRLHGADLRDNPYVAGRSTAHLASAECFSVMGIPLRDRKGRVLGIVKVDNKKGGAGLAGPDAFFDETDEFIARLLLDKIVLVLESLRTFEAFRRLIEHMHRAGSLDEFLEETLKIGMALLQADRGHFIWWDVAERRSVIRALVGESSLSKGDILPGHGIVHDVLKTGEPHLVKDVQGYAGDYYQANPSTRSEITVRLEFEGRALGVLNMESSRVNGFDEQDLELLRLLAHHAAIAAQVVGKEIHFRGIVQRLAEQAPSQEEVLRSILASVESSYGFDAGLIFIPDYTLNLLRCSAHTGADSLGVDPADFAIRFDEEALATKVFKEQEAYFSADPATDKNISPKGRETFRLGGALVAIPLIFRGRTVGVLISWSRRNPPPREEHKELLKPLAHLAAMTIAIAESGQQRVKVLEKIEEILTQMQTELSLEKNLHQILLGVQAAGFDKVRAFEFREGAAAFVGLDSVGMSDPEGFAGLTISLDENPYARHLAESWQGNPAARKYGAEKFGPDPDAERLEKDPQMPWAVVPLVIAKKLYGQITADNRPTKRDITDDSLEYLTLLGALASQAIADEERIAAIDELNGLRARKFREQFLRVALHNFNRPVHSVFNIAEKLTAEDDLPAPQSRHWLRMMNEQAQHLVKLSQQAHTYMRLQNPERPRDSVSLAELVRNAVEEFRFDAEGRGIRLELSPPEDDCELTADRDALAIVLRNLLDNALKFSPDGGVIRVELGAHPVGCRGSVTDQGPGVPEAERETIFKDFTSIARADVPESTGLGLSIAKFVVEEHHGFLLCEDGPGQCGARFSFILPRRGAEELKLGKERA